MAETPFSNGNTFEFFRQLEMTAVREIDSLENDYVLKASLAELENYFLDRYIVVPLKIEATNYALEGQRSVNIPRLRPSSIPIHFDREQSSAKGTELSIALPYTGDGRLWRLRASHFTLHDYPELEIRGDEVVFHCSFQDDQANADRLKNQIESAINMLTDAVNSIQTDVENHNRGTESSIRTMLSQKIAKAKTASGAIAALGIPMKPRSQPSTFVVPTKRRHASVTRPAVTAEKFAPEPALDQSQYEHILGIVKSMSLVMERSSETFATLDEEAIRTHFLLQLNGHYEGTATGETFNAAGKTDILIRVENRNIFIAECKFWRGEKSFDGAIDQLLSYLSWRDSKSALLIFNRKKSSTAVRQKMHEIMLARTEYRKTIAHDEHGDSRYTFVKASDPGREIQVTTMLFDIPSGETDAD